MPLTGSLPSASRTQYQQSSFTAPTPRAFLARLALSLEKPAGCPLRGGVNVGGFHKSVLQQLRKPCLAVGCVVVTGMMFRQQRPRGVLRMAFPLDRGDTIVASLD